MLFSIIIANYNKADNISALLSSIYDTYPHNDFEVFFMDDASSDASLDAARKFPVRLHAGNANIGPAALRNMAARNACGDFLLFIDSDVILPTGVLTNFRNLCLSRKFAAVYGLEVLPPVIDNWIGNFRTLQIQDQWGKYREQEAYVRSWGTTFGAIRRDLFYSIGGFNESYRGADVEDHELVARIDGKQIILYTPQLTYRHTYTGTSELMIKQFRRASSMVKIKQKYIVSNSFYGLRFALSHLFTVITVAGIAACFYDRRWTFAVICALLLKASFHRYLLYRALAMKGMAFAFYCYVANLLMSFCVISGGLYGTLSRIRK